MDEQPKITVSVELGIQEWSELERIAPNFGHDEVEHLLPMIIRAGLDWAYTEMQRADGEAKGLVQKARRQRKKNPAINLDDDIPF